MPEETPRQRVMLRNAALCLCRCDLQDRLKTCSELEAYVNDAMSTVWHQVLALTSASSQAQPSIARGTSRPRPRRPTQPPPTQCPTPERSPRRAWRSTRLPRSPRTRRPRRRPPHPPSSRPSRPSPVLCPPPFEKRGEVGVRQMPTQLE